MGFLRNLKNLSQSSGEPVDTRGTTGPQGSNLYINNTSYSGADIKVVVNVYDNGALAKEQLAQLETELDSAQKALNSLISERSSLYRTIQTTRSGITKHNDALDRLTKVQQEIVSTEQFIPSLEDRLQTLRQQNVPVSTKVLAEVQTLSMSTHRDKIAVRACGSVYPKGFTRGPRHIAGSMIFTVFHEHVLYKFLSAHPSDFEASNITSALLDQLPPVDIVISLANEYGAISRMAIYGVEFVDDGQVMSIEDILTENTVSFVARDLDPLRSVDQRALDENSIEVHKQNMKRASELILEDEYQEAKNLLDPFERFRRRRNPFI